MPRFAANLSLMYTEHDFLSRFAAAANDGFRAVECLFPYEYEARALAQRLADHGLAQVLFNARPGQWHAGERGLAALPGREHEFRRDFTDQAKGRPLPPWKNATPFRQPAAATPARR